MRLDRLEIINDEFRADEVTPSQLDLLLADGWRHFGTYFFRYNFGICEDQIRRVIPLRIRLADLKLSKSLRRILRKNANFETVIRPAEITSETHELFERHKLRFKSGVPDSIFDFLSRESNAKPTAVFEVNVRSDGKLVAASFFDVGEISLSSIYGIFDPAESIRSLGIFTMLKEIEFAVDRDKSFYYHGYAYEGRSYYDYKKRFSALERFEWNGNWKEYDNGDEKEFRPFE